MIINTTQWKPEDIKKVVALVGKPLNWFQNVRVHGWKSPKYGIVEMSPAFDEYSVGLEEEEYCEIEMRPNGIVIHFTRLFEHYAWVIPYYHLTLYKSGRIVTVYLNTDFIKLKLEEGDKKAKALIQKVMIEKGRLDEENDIRQVYDSF